MPAVAEMIQPHEGEVVLRMSVGTAQVVGWALEHFIPVTAEPVAATEARDALRAAHII